MVRLHPLITICLILFSFSCSTKKDIIYLQNTESISDYNIEYLSYKIKSDDILKIELKSEVPAALLVEFSSDNNTISNNEIGFLMNGYQVDKQGNINYPGIGTIKAEGKSIEELRSKMYELIVEKKILNDPFIDIKLLNTYFTILGEVKQPGKYTYYKNNLNILEALGMAGDLTIFGERNDIKIIRNNGERSSVFSIDITNSDFIKSKAFQIFSGDIIVVNPNNNRVKNAGIIGNSGTLLSLLSFLLSSIILITNG